MQERKKIVHIVQEMFGFLLYNKINNLKIEFKKEKDNCQILYIVEGDLDKLQNLNKDLHTKLDNELRDLAIEELVWELTGDTLDLHYVGILVDNKSIWIEDNKLYIKLERKFSDKCFIA